MPGLGRRTFAPGEVLTATNVMGYLQDQAVMNFAGTAARGSAIGTAVSEGMVSYLSDQDSIELYNGTAWVNASNVGRGLRATSQSLLTTTFSANTNTEILRVTFNVFAGRRYLISGKIAVQPNASAGVNALYVSETTMGPEILAYKTTAIGANLNESFSGFHTATAADMGVTSGSASKTIGLFWRCGAGGGIATNPDSVLGANSFIPQLIVEDIGPS